FRFHGCGILTFRLEILLPNLIFRISIADSMPLDSMTVSIIDKFRSTGQPICSAEDIARQILGMMTTDGMNGKAVYVEGGQGGEIEDGLSETMPLWLGEKP